MRYRFVRRIAALRVELYQIMTPPDDIQAESVATVEFEQDLQTLVLESFAKGAAVEGTWEIALPCSHVPDWTVTIRKTPCEETSYEPVLLEEDSRESSQ